MQVTMDGALYVAACNSYSRAANTSQVVLNKMISSERYSRQGASPRGGALAENG